MNTINLGAAGAGNEVINHTNYANAHDNILQFDGDSAGGGQDVLSLDGMFDTLDVATADRAGRVTLNDKGATIEVRVDVFGDGSVIHFAATINSASAISVGEDVLVGTL